MTWFLDGDGWRDDSTEGPYDTLKIHLGAKGELQIYRGYHDEKYRVTYDYCGDIMQDTVLIGNEDSVALAKAKAEQWYKENVGEFTR
jgi:hypothetical protein